MRVQTKITLLLAVVVTAFLLALFGLRTYDRIKFRRVIQNRSIERQHSFDQFLTHNGAALKALAEDYTSWDEMVRAVRTNNLDWLGRSVNQSTLDSFRAQAIWIFRPDGTLLYPLTFPEFEDLQQFPVSAGELQKIFSNAPLVHFFMQSSHGVMELRGGVIHPSKDFRRETAAEGYFLAARLWNQPAIDEMSIFTGNRIRIASAEQPPPRDNVDEQTGRVTFSRTLDGWNGERVAQLFVQSDSPAVGELNRENLILLLALTAFSLLLLVFVWILLIRWVRRPLAAIMQSLKSGETASIEPMCQADSEFGELARTVRQFFSQRDDLIKEMEERRLAQESLQQKEDQLRQSQKMEAVGSLAGGIAHDFNNLLTAIIGYAELIVARPHGDNASKQDASLIRKAGERAATLTRQLLAFSRKQLLQPRILDLNHLVADMEALLLRVIGEKFELRTQCDAVDGRVRADPSQLEQVILNLAVNARDAMPGGGRVTIRTANEHVDASNSGDVSTPGPAGDCVVLTVSDTGVGIPDDIKSHIFEPFFTTKGPGKGTGLGLATVYGIVRQSGGSISLETERGRGTTFRIYLPYQRAPIDQVRQVPTGPLSGDNSETVMVVEDDAVVRQLVCSVLEEHGYTVLCAVDGADAIRMSEKYEDTIDLLVTDVVMPQMNGPELASRLSLARPELKVLYVSGYSTHDIGDHGVVGKDIELLQKPFTPYTFLQRIREVLSRDHAWAADGAESSAAQLRFAI